MNFTSAVFLYQFLPAFLGLYTLAQPRYRAWVLTAFSYVFYGWWRFDLVVLMATSTVIDYACGAGIGRAQRRARDAGSSVPLTVSARRPGVQFVWLSCATNLCLLAYFKYANFGVDALNDLLAASGRAPLQWVDVVLPIGISFYTFQTISYTVDVYRGHAEPVRRFGDFACYVAMFPQLVAGPIVRYSTVAAQLRDRTQDLRRFATGVLFFQAGLAKKVLIADSLAPTADAAFGATALAQGEAWLGALAYTFQLYFDFSGYSDMAIGLGLMIGFRFPINFDRPYTARSVTEFWQRWHISLSTFLRDYLYIPLGGNRRGPLRTYANLMLVMLLGGLWHGAAWNFVLWGAFHGLWLAVERLTGLATPRGPAAAALGRARTFALVVVAWVLFRASSGSAALGYLGALFGVGAEDASAGLVMTRGVWWALALAALLAFGAPTTQALVARRSRAWLIFLQLAFFASLVTLHDAANVPFLYFQF